MSSRSDVMAAMSSSSAGKPAMDSSSAAKPAMDCIVAFYNINWDKGRFEKPEKHELSLAADILTALDDFSADLVLLSECGEVGIGLDPEQWLPMIGRICGPGFAVTHQSHYTSIVRKDTMEATAEPSLQGPLTILPNHEYRMCQHLQVVVKGSAGKPIDIYNVHSPDSGERPLVLTAREHVLQWFARNAGTQALIGGDLNSSLPSLDAGFKHYPEFHYCYEAGHLHGDLVIAKGLDAVSTPCEVTSTSKAHKMVVVMVTMEAGITLTSRWPHRLSAEKPDEDAEMVLVSQAEKTRTMLKRKRNQEAEADAMEM